MVLVEGVSRALDPDLDIWTVSEPVVGDFVRREAGPIGRLEDLAEHLRTGASAVGRLPAILSKAEAALDDFHAERIKPRSVWWMWLVALVGVVVLWRILS
jgi:ubiquinone biosynthesis protein